MNQLQGAWKVTSVDLGGTVMDIKQLGMGLLRIEGNKSKYFNGDRKLIEGELKLDPGTSPKRMDWFAKDKGQYPLIYALDADNLQLCFPMTKEKLEAPLERPTKFENPGKPIALLKAERQK